MPPIYVSPEGRARQLAVYEEHKQSIYDAKNMEEFTAAITKLSLGMALASGRITQNHAFTVLSTMRVKAPEEIPGECLDAKLTRVSLAVNHALSIAIHRITEDQKQMRSTLSMELLGHAPSAISEMRERKNKQLLLQVMNNERQALEQRLTERFSKIQAYMAFFKIQKIDPRTITKSQFDTSKGQFAAFWKAYQVDQANKNAERLKSEPVPAPVSVNPKTAKKKARKQKNKVSTPASVTVHLPAAAAVVPPVKTPDQLRQETCLAWMLTPSFPSAGRVDRWETNDLAKIRTFTDGHGDSTTHPYADAEAIPDDQLRIIKACHDTPGPEKLITAVPGAYDFVTDTGCGMLCHIQFDDVSRPTIGGVLYFGIDRTRHNLVYHRFLKERTDKESIKSVFKGPKLQAELSQAVDDLTAEEKEFTVVGKFEATIAANGVLRFRYPTKGYSLFVHPIDPTSLPQGLI